MLLDYDFADVSMREKLWAEKVEGLNHIFQRIMPIRMTLLQI